MDTFTQIALGAAVGQLAGRKRLGRGALAVGAAGGLLPDLDMLVVPALGPLAEWQFQRGVTHSLFFGPVVGPALGWATSAAARRLRPASAWADRDTLGPLVAVWVLALVTHPLLDLFTIYGTQLLAPFSDARFAIPAVPIIDPVYTLLLVAALIVGCLPRAVHAARIAAAVALTLSTAYLFYGWAQNQRAEALARADLAARGVVADVRAYTTIFQPWLRRVVARDLAGVHVGWVSTWAPGAIAWTCFAPPPRAPVEAALTAHAAQVFAHFASGQVWARVRRDDRGRTVVRLTDLRYGFPGATALGWWGVDITLDDGGHPIAAARIVIPRTVTRGAVAAVYAAGFGDLAALHAAVGEPAPVQLAAGQSDACAS